MVDRDGGTEEVTQIEVVTPPPDAGSFGPGAFVPASDGISLRERMAQAKATGAGPAPRGRAASAKTEAKAAPRSRRSAPEPTPREAKKARSDEITGFLTGEVNDTVLSFFVSQGMPAGAIWKSGQTPLPQGDLSKYTPRGAKLAIDGFTARSIASFMAELETSEVMGKAVESATSGPIGLLLKGGLAAACAIGYVQGVLQVVTELREIRQRVEEFRSQQPIAQREAQAIYGLN